MNSFQSLVQFVNSFLLNNSTLVICFWTFWNRHTLPIIR